MTILICFLCGIACVTFALPILQYIADTICSFFELIKSNISVKITENNVKIQNLHDSLEPINTNAIGFHSDDETVYYEDDDDEEEDRHKSINKIGFRG